MKLIRDKRSAQEMDSIGGGGGKGDRGSTRADSYRFFTRITLVARTITKNSFPFLLLPSSFFPNLFFPSRTIYDGISFTNDGNVISDGDFSATIRNI